jgi:PAS domain S-box-containing protein
MQFIATDLNPFIRDAPVGLCILHAKDLTIETANTHLQRLLGKRSHELAGKPYGEIFDVIRPGNASALKAAAEGNAYEDNYGATVHLRDSANKVIPATVIYTPVKNSRGGVGRIAIWILENADGSVNEELAAINEELAAANEEFVAMNEELAGTNEELAKSNAELLEAQKSLATLATIVETSYDAIISKTLESVVTSWNAAAERMFGYKAEEMIGETIYKIIPEDRHDEEPKILARLRTGERVQHFETKRLTKDRHLLDVSLTISPIMDKHAQIIGLSKIARDITIQKQEEQRKSDFIAVVSHELRTPLTTLTALIQVVHRKMVQQGEQFVSATMEKANLQAKRMAIMINGFLQVSRLEAGKLSIEKQPFDIGRLLEEIVEETRLIVSSHVFNLAECDNLIVNADRDKITSVISNLISNAVKYSPKVNIIDIRCRLRENMVVVSVKDSGIGLKREELSHVFDRFYRVETSNTRHISGFGIGLYLSKGIIKSHGGEIWAESELNDGTTFYFSLPLAQFAN